MKRLSFKSGWLALVAVLTVTSLTQVSTDLAAPVNVPGIDKPVIVVTGRVTGNETWTSGNYYVLRGAVFVDDGATLNIQAGTRVIGEAGSVGSLIVLRGGRLNAIGTREQPIVFTSDQPGFSAYTNASGKSIPLSPLGNRDWLGYDDGVARRELIRDVADDADLRLLRAVPVGSRARGDWGGIIINGRAPVNIPGGEGVGEADTGIYGGNQPNDNSGTMRYVRVEFAGVEFSPDNELNGIAFQGVGNGGSYEYIQVHMNKDDGLEWFGGTADIKRAVVSNAADDSFDWTFGWIGRAQFIAVHQRGDDADNGIEADNNEFNNELLPRANPQIYNMTMCGDPDRNEGGESTRAVLFRRGTAVTFRNFLITGFKTTGLQIDNPATITQVNNGTTQIGAGAIWGQATNLHSSAAPFVQSGRFPDVSLHGKSVMQLQARVNEWPRGGDGSVLKVEFTGETTDYETFRVRRKSVVVVRTAAGVESRHRLFGSMIEEAGRYKVFSYVVD